MRKVVGIDRKIKQAWLDAALDRLAQTTDEAELRPFLDQHLQNELPGKASRAKTTGILLRIWCSIPQERIPLRDRALALLPLIPGQERIWLHWGMTARAYPFFRDTAEVVGRLLALADDFTSAQVQARMLTSWGDRATSKEAAQKLINTLVDWEMLRSTKVRGHFLLARKMKTSVPDLQLWLLEALLGTSSADEIEAQQLLRLPEAFPFTMSIGVADLRVYQGFDIHRQGLDMDMVALRKVKVEKPQKRSKKRKMDAINNLVHPGLFDTLEDCPSAAIDIPRPVPDANVSGPQVREDQGVMSERLEIEEAINKDSSNRLTDRASRYPQVRPSGVAPEGPFSIPLMECSETFQDGHYYGCIALTKMLLEAIIRHVWEIEVKKDPNQHGSFGRNIEELCEKGAISGEWKAKLFALWSDLQPLQYLKYFAAQDRTLLQEKACSSLKVVNELESEFFEFSIKNGKLVPKRPEYWLVNE